MKMDTVREDGEAQKGLEETYTAEKPRLPHRLRAGPHRKERNSDHHESTTCR
jgi:hypothetical protein